MGFRIDKFNFNLPFGLGGVQVVRSEAQREVAWMLYVEYSTRISTQPLHAGEGSVREALSSLHALFGITREVLKGQGPRIAEGPESVGVLAIRILNEGVRPFLVEWHTKRSRFELDEITRQRELSKTAPLVDEATWEQREAFYEALNLFRQEMLEYVKLLATLADVA